MKILIAEDDPVSSMVLQTCLQKWGHEVISTTDGGAAWTRVKEPDSPKMAILDIMMPEMDGISVCRKLREARRDVYIILLTALGQKQNVIDGLDAGADDYVTKPCDQEELRLRIQTGVRILNLQEELNHRIGELENALGQIKQLQKLLPICTYCKKIRDGKNYWQQVERYISENANVRFSHSICPECYEKIVKPQMDAKPAA